MIIVDRMIVGGIKFVLGKIANAVDEQLNDDSVLKEQLLHAQMQFELGEISDDEFQTIESDLLARIREIQERRGGGQAISPSAAGVKVTGVEASFGGDDADD